jgi:CheY-like chemotaxis protein
MTPSSQSKLFLVEDNVADVPLLRFALDKQGRPYQLEVLTVATWSDHIADAASWVLVPDMHLPKHDGAEVLRAIRRREAYRTCA